MKEESGNSVEKSGKHVLNYRLSLFTDYFDYFLFQCNTSKIKLIFSKKLKFVLINN